MIREELIPKKDEKVATKLKNIILEIEDVLEDDTKQEFIEKKMEEANKLLEPFNQSINLYTVEYYYSWTSLDDLVGCLTIKVPEKIDLSEEELAELIIYIQDVLIKSTDVEEYKFNFYHEYITKNYSVEILNEIFEENVNVAELAKKMKNFKKSVSVINL